MFGQMDVKVQIRYRDNYYPAKLTYFPDDISPNSEGWFIRFNEPIKGLTSGQFAAIYDDSELIASGVIDTKHASLSGEEKEELLGITQIS